MNAVLKQRSIFEQALDEVRDEMRRGHADDAIANAVHIDGDAVVAYLEECDGIVPAIAEAVSDLDGSRFDKLGSLVGELIKDDISITEAQALIELLRAVMIDHTRDSLRRRLEAALA